MKIFFLLILFSLLLFTPLFAEDGNPLHVNVITIEDEVINPIIEEYIETAIQHSEAEAVECLIIQIDTPGGLLTSTRNIVKTIINADIPVIAYISPSGSRAGSAGVFITLASHIAAMAPSTNIGAAHPVNIGGKQRSIQDILHELMRTVRNKTTQQDNESTNESNEQTEETDAEILSQKILNDTVAWIKSIAKNRGRNIEWAEQAVRQSVSQTEKEALALNIVDVVATNIPNLLTQIDGKEVTLHEERIQKLNTKDAVINYIPLTFRQRVLMAISHPNIAYILMMLGFYGLLFEVTHPGIGFPGIAGVICLIIAFFSLSMLPINYAGLLLIIVSVILFIAEINVPSFGLLTLGGLVCMFLGSLMLIDSQYTFMRVSIEVIIPIVLATATITLFLVSAVIKAHKRKSVVGRGAIIGQIGTAETDINPTGSVSVHGELWTARAKEPINKKEKVLIQDIDHLELIVTKADQ